MKKKKLLVLPIVVLLMVALLLSACTNNGSNNVNENEQISNNASSTVTEGNDNGEQAEQIELPLEKSVTLTMVAQKAAQVKKDYNEMSFFAEMEENTNVNVDWEYLSTETALEKMNLMFATNDMPDAFFGPGTLELVDIATSQSQLLPLNDLIDKHAPNIKKMLDENPKMKDRITMSDGNIYTVPVIKDDKRNMVPDTIFINQKWLDELDLDMPTTIEEFEEVLRAFKGKDLNQNGKADEIPMSFVARNHISGINSLAAAFGKTLPSMNNHFVHVEDGKPYFAPALEENKAFYVWLNELFQDGLIDPEVFTHNGATYHAKLKSEDSLYGVFAAWSETSAFGTKEEKKAEYVQLLPLEGPEGETGWNIQDSYIVPQAFGITRVNEHPEVTMAWVDRFFTPDLSLGSHLGTVGTVLTKKDGKYEFAPNPEGLSAPDFRYDNAPGAYGLFYIPTDVMDQVVWDDHYNEKMEYVNKLWPVVPEEYFSPSIMLGAEEADREKVEQWNTDVIVPNAYYDQSFAKIVTSKNPEKDWKEMVDNLQGYGMEEVMAIYEKYMK